MFVGLGRIFGASAPVAAEKGMCCTKVADPKVLDGRAMRIGAISGDCFWGLRID